MKIEDKLRTHIVSEYGSLLGFTEETGIAYGTLQGVLNRGIRKSSITIMIKICESLGISLDELLNGNISHAEEPSELDVSEIVQLRLTVDHKRLDESEVQILGDCLDTAISIIRRKRGMK